MPHALLVDDNTDTLEALTEVLRAEGFTASAAPNLDEAKAALARQTPDVVLLDLNLPDGSGMTLLDGIEGLRAPAVVLITGHASVSTVVEALRRGVTDYLTKPVDVDRLRTILGNIAHTRQLPDEIKTLQSLSLSNLPPLAPDKSNLVADDSRAVALGQRLFFDKRFSADGTVSCASCHMPELNFQDARAHGRGTPHSGGRATTGDARWRTRSNRP